MYDDRKLVGIGGWLAVFLVIMAAYMPFDAIRDLYNFYSDPRPRDFAGAAWPAWERFEWAVAAIKIGGAWYLSWRMLRGETWQTVRVAIAGIWIIFFGLSAVRIAGWWLIWGFPIVELTAVIGVLMLLEALLPVFWTVYFLRSRRVANTYPRDPYLIPC